MTMTSSIPDILSVVIAASFLLAGTLNVYGPQFVRAEFTAWGYPPFLRYGVGVMEWVVALLLSFQSSRLVAASMGISILLGVLVSLVRSRAWHRMEYPIVLGILLVLVLLCDAESVGKSAIDKARLAIADQQAQSSSAADRGNATISPNSSATPIRTWPRRSTNSPKNAGKDLYA